MKRIKFETQIQWQARWRTVHVACDVNADGGVEVTSVRLELLGSLPPEEHEFLCMRADELARERGAS